MWDTAGRLTTGCVVAVSGGRPRSCLAAVDPQTLNIQVRWLPPASQDLNLAYLAETTEDQVVVTTRQGHVFVVQRRDDANGPSFSLVRDVDLIGERVLKPTELLLAAMFDSRGKIWFTTGGILGIGDQPAPFTTLGFIDLTGRVHSIRIADQIVENGFAVSGTTAFVVTGPAGADDHPGANGYMAAFRAGPHGTVETRWRDAYPAGDARKPGGFARGSGSTPTLLGHRYVAITDNANSQIHLRIYRQGKVEAGDHQLVCSVPLFSPGASANDIGTIGEEIHGTDSGMALNDYNAPPIQLALTPATINGFNNMNQMAPGAERVDIGGDGRGCRVVWDTPIRIKSVPFLSTATGLVYGYTQDAELTAGGQYVWYFVALDYRSGKEVWRIRAGAGGTYNDSYEPGSLGPDGSFYQGLPFGVVRLRDATRPST
jgi:hypothetical protein